MNIDQIRCRKKRMELGLIYPRSSCEKCGSLLRPNFRCAEDESIKTDFSQTTNYKVVLQSLTIQAFDNDILSRDIAVTGHGYLVNHPNEPYFRINFTIERQKLTSSPKLKIESAVVFAGMDQEKQRELALDIKRRFKVILMDKIKEINNQASP